jgi:hypothetical protein
MKRVLLLLFFLMYFLGYSQSKIKVVDDTSQKPVSNAKISCDNKILGYTNEQGMLEFKTDCRNISIDADSYQIETASVESSMEVSCSKRVQKQPPSKQWSLKIKVIPGLWKS